MIEEAPMPLDATEMACPSTAPWKSAHQLTTAAAGEPEGDVTRLNRSPCAAVTFPSITPVVLLSEIVTVNAVST